LLAVVQWQLGRLREALSSYDKALTLNPDHADAWSNRGVTLYSLKRFEEALSSYDKALAINPGDPQAWSNRGAALYDLNRCEETLSSYDKALAIDPDHAEAWSNRGAALYSLNRLEEALSSYDQALAIQPDHVEALNNRGNALQQLKRFGEAVSSYDAALALRPDYVEALASRGNALQQLKRFEEALSSYDKALATNPDHVEALNGRAKALQRLKRFEEALSSYDRALAIKPGYAEALFNRGVALQQAKQFAEALSSYDKALAIKPDNIEALTNRGLVLYESNRLDEAIASYDKALALRPDCAEAYINRGNALSRLSCVDEAIASYDQAVALQPDLALARFNRSLLLLLKGNYVSGWDEYEWRLKGGMDYVEFRKFPEPQWRGEDDLTGKTIFVYAEQGYGDTIQFLRYVPLLASRGARVLLEVPLALLRLARRLAGAAQVFPPAEAPLRFDFWSPLMSLPRAFGTIVANIPCEVPYLAPDPLQAEAWRGRLTHLRGLRVGLVWAGGAHSHQHEAATTDRRRSVTLVHFAKLADIPGLSFVSLQKGEGALQTSSPPPGFVVADWTNQLTDFADTAALIAALDLVISVDTSVVHLAGALGKPVWLLNRFDTCWRWLLDRDDSPWYPLLRQFRQPKAGDWDSVIVEVRKALGRFATGDRS
jgi:tetratricopeptide (TPR) repeat protein